MDEKYWENAKAEIQKWETSGPGYLARAGDLILWPAQTTAELLIPHGIQDAIGKAIVGVLSGLTDAAAWSFDANTVQARVNECSKKTSDELRAGDAAAKHFWNWNISHATVEGIGTGALGWWGLPADIPALFMISLRSIQQIGKCYGYDTSSESEKEYVLQVLRTGSTGDIKAKVEFLIVLKQVEQVLLRVTWKKMGQELANKQISKLAVLAAVRQFAKSLGVQITKRKALQTIPVVGALVGGTFNGVFLNDVGHAAYISYRRRYIAEHEGLQLPAATASSPTE